eukprot:TRINITY_DN27552_c0_g2_i1.p1 TRINITY_DN27552_c0_g2~~TRINITY_DN27552_c0_g2_i1.p1  ORF type:complete len:2211 (-),score=393.20 TRINITY_DN27552_c0_g2_i1:58-6690(-)
MATAEPRPFGERVKLLESAVADAENGAITNARKLEALSQLEELLPSVAKAEVLEQRARLEDLCERILSQNATDPLRRLVVAVLDALFKFGDSSLLFSFVGRLLKLTGDAPKKASNDKVNDTKVAALDVIGQLLALRGPALESFCNEVYVVIAKHMKMNEASARCAALQCLYKAVAHCGVRSLSTAGNVWKMLQKMMLDRALSVRTAAAQALSALMMVCPECAAANGEAMALSCLKTLATEDPPSQFSSLCSENRSAVTTALAKVLAAMASPAAAAAPDRPKKKPAVTDFSSAVEFLEQAVVKGPAAGPVFVGFRSAVSFATVLLAETQGVSDAASLSLVVKALLNALEMPGVAKGSRSAAPAADEEQLMQVATHLGTSFERLLRLAEAEGCLIDFIEQGLMPAISVQFNETSRSAEMRMLVAIGAMCRAIAASGESFRSLEAKVAKPLLHIVGSYPNSLVQLHTAFCIRSVAHGSPAQLFQLMSVLLNLSTVQNAEVLGRPKGDAKELQPLLRGLFGHCAALAALSGELFCSELRVPHDVTSAVLGTSQALLQPHSNPSVSAQRRSCAFLLLEGLMSLGSDWVGQRLTTLFALWKTALGKKSVDRAKVLYQEHAAADSSSSASESISTACRDELTSLLFALRSLYTFTCHSRETLLTSLPHLHKILVVFLSNISQFVVALPHPTSPNLRAKYRQEASLASTSNPFVLSMHCAIPEILLMIRAMMYRTFAAMQPSLYATRFVHLLNMLADDVTRALPSDFPVSELLAHSLPRSDIVLDLVDTYLETSRDCPSTTRLSVNRLLSIGPTNADIGKGEEEPFAEDLCSDIGAASSFSVLSRESLGGNECILTPWDAWFDPSRSLADQCVSPEWDWRCSSVKLLAVILNASEVGETPRSAVLQHLLKRKESSDDTPATARRSSTTSTSTPAFAMGTQAELHVVSSLAVLAYVREHVRVRGLSAAPPGAAMEQVMRFSLASLKEANPALRRVHVEILALLFFAHHQLPESPIVPTILQHFAGESLAPSSETKGDAQGREAERLRERSAVALLCGAILRTFSWGWKVLANQETGNGGTAFRCPYIMNVVPALLKLAKETAQPVRLWMLYALHLCVEAAGTAFSPFLRDSLRLTTAHLLADFFESPLMLWAVSELTNSAAKLLSQSDSSDMDYAEENVLRLLGLWRTLRHVRYTQPSGGYAFAIVRTEVAGMSAIEYTARLLPDANVKSLLSQKLGQAAENEGREGSEVCVVRTCAAKCLKALVDSEAGGASDVYSKEPTPLFNMLNASKGIEAKALEEFILAVLNQHGLQNLQNWLQALKALVLAQGGKGDAKETVSSSPAAAKGEDDRNVDEVDDEASMAGQKPQEAASNNRSHSTRVATKVFGISCVQRLLELARQGDPEHFQSVYQGSPAEADASRTPPPEGRLITHLDVLIALAVNAASSDEASLAAAGLRLMLLVVQRFQHTQDVQGHLEGMECPLLLTQFEAQVTTSIRHNLRATANPCVVRNALELLHDVIAIRAFVSTQRLIALLMQPINSPAFEPDPLFCEAASTETFLYRLRCACDVLDSGQSQEQAAVASYSRDLTRWIESALRDGAVLLAGLPLQNVKTYQPTCFNSADYKAVQPYFRAAFPSLLRGVCALCNQQTSTSSQQPRSPSSGAAPPSPSAAARAWVLSKEIASLSLGIIVLLLSQGAELTVADLRVFIRTMRHVLMLSAAPSVKEVMVSAPCFLDLMGCFWKEIFNVPTRCSGVLPDILELLHAISGALWRKRSPGSPTISASGQDSKTPVDDLPWLRGLCADTAEGVASRATIGAYVFQAVAAALRCPEVVADAERTSMALEVLIWWLSDSLPRSLEAGCGEEEEELVARALSVDSEEAGMVTDGRATSATTGVTCVWLWLLFLTPFPDGLVQSQPAVTLKYWRIVCALLSAARANDQPFRSTNQLLQLALIVNRLLGSLLSMLDASPAPIAEASERNIVYSFAMLVPAVSSMASVLKPGLVGQAVEGELPLPADVGMESAKSAARKCLVRLRQLFELSLVHESGKVAQTAASSAQNLLQNPACGELYEVIVPCLVSAMACEPPRMPTAAAEVAWGVISTMHAVQHQSGCQELVRATTQLVLRLVGALANFQRERPGSVPAGQTAAMAQCLVQVAQTDQAGLKEEVAAMSSASQLTIQQLLREHMSASGRADSVAAAASTASKAALAEKKIELKIKF